MKPFAKAFRIMAWAVLVLLVTPGSGVWAGAEAAGEAVITVGSVGLDWEAPYSLEVVSAPFMKELGRRGGYLVSFVARNDSADVVHGISVGLVRRGADGRVREVQVRRWDVTVLPGEAQMRSASFDAVRAGEGEELVLAPFPLGELPERRAKRRFEERLADLQAELGSEKSAEMLERISELERGATGTGSVPLSTKGISLDQCLSFCADCARLGAIICDGSIKELDCNCSDGICRIVCG